MTLKEMEEIKTKIGNITVQELLDEKIKNKLTEIWLLLDDIRNLQN